MEPFSEKIVSALNISTARKPDVEELLSYTSYYKIKPYMHSVINNESFLKEYFPNNDSFDLCLKLFQLNKTMALSLNCYLDIVENALKTRINNYLTEKFGYEWYTSKCFYDQLTDNNKDFIENKVAKYLSETLKPQLMDFVENHVPFGFWTSLISDDKLWNNKNVELRTIFDQYRMPASKLKYKEIKRKFKSIRILRNKVHHYNQIICCPIDHDRMDVTLYQIYEDILYINKLLGIQDYDNKIPDICSEFSFEFLYNKYKKLLETVQIKVYKDLGG